MGSKDLSTFFCALLIAIAAVSVRAQDTTPEATPLARTYTLFVPGGYDAGEALPLVMVLHGASGSGARSQGWLGFDELAEADNVLVVYPDGLYNNWDFGAGVPTPDGAIRVEDVAYLSGLVDELAETYAIDRERVFVAGMSNGALMAYRLLCEAPGVFRGIAGVAAGVFVMAVQHCDDSPTPVLFIQGTEDRILPWDGTLLNGQYIGLSAADSLAFWAAFNGCDTGVEAVQQMKLPDADKTDASTVTHLLMEACMDGSEVQFYAVVGGGHTWPGRPFETGFDLGAVNLDMDATQVVWDWFMALA